MSFNARIKDGEPNDDRAFNPGFKKHKHIMQEVYKGWTISVKNKAYKIIGFEPDGKAHVLYSHVGTSTKKKQYDPFGNMLYDAYVSDAQAMEKAKAYIDNFEDRLKQYLINRTEKRKAIKDQKATTGKF